MDVRELAQKINSLDVDDLKRIGSAPAPIRIAAIIVLCVAVIGAGIWFLILPEFDRLGRSEAEELKLRQEFIKVHNKAVNLGAYKEQLDEMRRSFGAMLRQLPDTTDIESLLVDLSQTSVATGLEVNFFKPGEERPKEFYAEYPIELSVVGGYHEFGNFVSGLAALPRIVTLQNIKLRAAPENAGGRLKMDLTAVTYRYLEEGAADEGTAQ